MTIKRWIAPLLSLVLISSLANISFAQGQFPAGGSYQPMGPANVFGNQGFNPPANSAINAASMPQGMQPWPAISPFENAYSETSWKNGVWSRLQIPQGSAAANRKYYGHVGAAKARFRETSPVRLGAVGVRQLGDAFGAIPFFVLNARVFHENNPNHMGLNSQGLFERFANDRSPGIEFSYGFTDVDKGGAELSFFWLTGTNQEWSRGSEDPGFRGATGAIAFDDGSGGFTYPLDNLTRLNFKSQAAGIDANIFNKPIFRGRNFQVRTLWGMRYTYLNEAFKFEGRDSGDGATYNPDGTLDTLTGPAQPGFRAELESIVQSHLFGPQTGFDFAVGGKNFKLGGFLKMGIMLNTERLSIEESGLDSPIAFDNTGATITNPNYNPNRTSAATKTSAHISPMFENDIHADMNVIKLIPVLKSMKMFDNAKFRVGYKFTGIWEVNRPYETIVWQGGPLNPAIDTNKRGFFFYDQWSASISFVR